MCPSAWQTIHAISRATYYRYKEMATLGKQAEGHGNLGSKKPRMHTMQATATLRVMIGDDADRMPNRTRTLNSGESSGNGTTINVSMERRTTKDK